MKFSDDEIAYLKKMIAEYKELPGHQNCRCTIIPKKPPSEFEEDMAKSKARDTLRNKKPRIILADADDLLGINLLDRDDQFRPERKDR